MHTGDSTAISRRTVHNGQFKGPSHMKTLLRALRE
jgi:hypothetical protein